MDAQVDGLGFLSPSDNTFLPPLFSSTLQSILGLYPYDSCFIDMPIGLASKKIPKRTCDHLARQLLSPRASTIFSPPSRAAIHCNDYETACKINQEVTGNKISKQAWNLSPKIIEVDTLLEKFSMHESHPELCLLGLSGSVIKTSKKLHEGQIERLELLNSYIHTTKEYYDENCRRYKKKEVAIDDLLDAMILSVSAKLSLKNSEYLNILEDPSDIDEKGRRMNLRYYSHSY